MSLILDALHRSDQERNHQNQVAGLHTLHRESPLSDFKARGILLAAGALLLAVLLWVWVGDMGQSPHTESTSSVSAAGDPAAGGPAAGGPAANLTPLSVPARAGHSALAVSPTVEPASAPVSPAERAILSPTPISAAPELAPVLPAGVAELYQRAEVTGAAPGAAGTRAAPEVPPPATTSTEPAASKSLPVEAIVAAAHREIAAPPLDHDTTPLVQDLPQDTRDALPSIFYSIHSWSNLDNEKQVTLNGDVRREGDTVMPGVRLLEITPDYIVLDFQDTRFRLRALNSWVNL